MVLEKVRTDGLWPRRWRRLQSKLDQPSGAGLLQRGRGGRDRVWRGGLRARRPRRFERQARESYACQAPVRAHPRGGVGRAGRFSRARGNPDCQGVRYQPDLGRVCGVTGLGLIGLVTVQLLRAQGCRVLALISDPSRLTLARQFGPRWWTFQGRRPLAAAAACRADVAWMR